VDEPRLPETMRAAGRRLRASTNASDAVDTDASFLSCPRRACPTAASPTNSSCAPCKAWPRG
jgi:hypothetical protein